MPSNSPTESPVRPPRFRRYLVRAAFVLACLGTLVVAFFLVEKFRGRAAWRAYEAEAKARGVKLDFAAFIPPKIPDAENFASTPIFDSAFRASDAKQPVPNPLKLPETQDVKQPKLSDPLKQERIDLAAWQKFFVETKLLPAASDNAAADVLKALDPFAAPLAELAAAGTRPNCHFPVHWEKAFAAELPHLQILQGASKLFALRMGAHLALGESAAAYEDFRTGLRLATATREEPSLIAGLVRIAIASAMQNALWSGLAARQWAEPELRKIEADLAGIDWLKDYLFAMGSERAGENLMADMLIENPGLLNSLIATEGTPRVNSFGAYPTGWFYQNKVRANHYFDEMLTRIDPAQRRYFGDRLSPSALDDIRSWPKRFYYLLFALLAPALESVEKKYVQAASVTDLARIAVALERFRLAREAFPQTLSELTPDFLAKLPVEIVSGESYRYRHTDAGSFVLYSVGADLRDDGGALDAKKSAKEQTDWVWRYPQ